MNDNNRLYLLASAALIVAVGIGYGVARLTEPPVATEKQQAKTTATGVDAVVIADQAISTSQIGVAPARAGDVSAVLLASATVQATPDAEAILTARASGTITRIGKRIGDFVRAGEPVAILESREASSIAADHASAAARVTLAERQLARERTLLAQGVSPRADFETAQANLAVAQADARRASSAAAAARVTGDGRHVAVVSPVSGRITAVQARLGEFVSAETDLFHVTDPGRFEIAAALPQADAARVRAGDRVEMTLPDGRIIEGHVRSTTGVIDPNTRGATVVISPNISGGALAPGQLVQARIFAQSGVTTTAVMVPIDAVQTLGDRTVVFVRTRRGFMAQTVQTGSRNGNMVAIVSGLKPNTLVATTNAFLLKAELEKESAE